MFIILDGTTHVCEAFVVVLMLPHRRLGAVCGTAEPLAKTMTGEEISQQIIVILSTEFGISFNLIVAVCVTEHLSMMWQCGQSKLCIMSC